MENSNERKKFTVDRKTWYRGQGSHESALLTNSGQRCCLGFVCQQMDVPDSAMRGVGSPAFLRDGLSKSVPFLTEEFSSENRTAFYNHVWVNQAMTTNDRLDLTDADREAKLKELFGANNIDLEFIN